MLAAHADGGSSAEGRPGLDRGASIGPAMTLGYAGAGAAHLLVAAVYAAAGQSEPLGEVFESSAHRQGMVQVYVRRPLEEHCDDAGDGLQLRPR